MPPRRRMVRPRGLLGGAWGTGRAVVGAEVGSVAAEDDMAFWRGWGEGCCGVAREKEEGSAGWRGLCVENGPLVVSGEQGKGVGALEGPQWAEVCQGVGGGWRPAKGARRLEGCTRGGLR